MDTDTNKRKYKYDQILKGITNRTLLRYVYDTPNEVFVF